MHDCGKQFSNNHIAQYKYPYSHGSGLIHFSVVVYKHSLVNESKFPRN